jgi:succinate-semialdehyde dehydrogenase / glutarate-semialdehyde dehydrogenase
MGMKLQAVNPATEEVEKEYTALDFNAAQAAVQRSTIVQADWKEISFADRSHLMKKAAAVLRKRKAAFAELITREMGKPITQSEGEIEKCAWVCEFYADNAETFLSEEHVKTESKKSYVRFDPIGTVLAIMPWNFPFWQVFRFAAPALMAGNAGILKHASNVPGSALAIQDVFEEAGFPTGLFQTLLIDSATAGKVIELPGIAAVTVTGSVGAGSKVAEIAGKHIKKTVLELGGSDPFIVLDDVNVKTCAIQAVNGRIVNAGQSCIAAKRFIVNENVIENFTKEFVKHMESMKVGDPLERDTQVGPLAKKEFVNDLERQLKQSVEQGATVLTGGKETKVNGTGYFFTPTVLGQVSLSMPVFAEETFGPLTGILSVKNDEEAVEIANATEFGLGASVWSQDIPRAEKLVPKINAGAVFVNKIVGSDPRLPFGGIKKSGYGRELSSYGIREFVNIKSVMIE